MICDQHCVHAIGTPLTTYTHRRGRHFCFYHRLRLDNYCTGYCNPQSINQS